MKKFVRITALLAVLALVLAACGGDDAADTTEGDTDTTAADTTMADTTEPSETTMVDTTEPTETTTETTTGEPAGDAITACEVTDTGGIDDASFNETAWRGVEDAIEAGYATEDSDFIESQAPADYGPNINSFIEADCGLIVTVGFLLTEATVEAATANPDQPFLLLDSAPDPELDNVVGAVFDTTGAAFMAGYLAAGVSQTGTVATYGGIQLPCAVTCFMDGFVYGVRYYNQQNDADVQVLGWNPEDETGVFTGDFESLENGRNVTQSFIDEGADVILPVAGPVGQGSAALAQELGDVWVIGVDADWKQTLPQYSDVILTSVLKGLDVAVLTTIQAVVDGTFQGGTQSFGIQEEGVGLGPIDESVDQALADEIQTIEDQLVSGELVPGDLAEG